MPERRGRTTIERAQPNGSRAEQERDLVVAAESGDGAALPPTGGGVPARDRGRVALVPRRDRGRAAGPGPGGCRGSPARRAALRPRAGHPVLGLRRVLGRARPCRSSSPRSRVRWPSPTGRPAGWPRCATPSASTSSRAAPKPATRRPQRRRPGSGRAQVESLLAAARRRAASEVWSGSDGSSTRRDGPAGRSPAAERRTSRCSTRSRAGRSAAWPTSWPSASGR